MIWWSCSPGNSDEWWASASAIFMLSKSATTLPQSEAMTRMTGLRFFSNVDSLSKVLSDQSQFLAGLLFRLAESRVGSGGLEIVLQKPQDVNQALLDGAHGDAFLLQLGD